MGRFIGQLVQNDSNASLCCARLSLQLKKKMTKTVDELYNYCTLKTIRSPSKPAFSVAKLSILSEMN